MCPKKARAHLIFISESVRKPEAISTAKWLYRQFSVHNFFLPASQGVPAEAPVAPGGVRRRQPHPTAVEDRDVCGISRRRLRPSDTLWPPTPQGRKARHRFFAEGRCAHSHKLQLDAINVGSHMVTPRRLRVNTPASHTLQSASVASQRMATASDADGSLSEVDSAGIPISELDKEVQPQGVTPSWGLLCSSKGLNYTNKDLQWITVYTRTQTVKFMTTFNQMCDISSVFCKKFCCCNHVLSVYVSASGKKLS